MVLPLLQTLGVLRTLCVLAVGVLYIILVEGLCTILVRGLLALFMIYLLTRVVSHTNTA